MHDDGSVKTTEATFQKSLLEQLSPRAVPQNGRGDMNVAMGVSAVPQKIFTVAMTPAARA